MLFMIFFKIRKAKKSEWVQVRAVISLISSCRIVLFDERIEQESSCGDLVPLPG